LNVLAQIGAECTILAQIGPFWIGLHQESPEWTVLAQVGQAWACILAFADEGQHDMTIMWVSTSTHCWTYNKYK
jgi:hypothetical protein